MITEKQAELISSDLKLATDTFIKTAAGMKGYRETVSGDVDNACATLIASGENSMLMVEKMMGVMLKMEERHAQASEMTSERMTKVEEAQQVTSDALIRILGQIEGMVKCVDSAILESKADKVHYYEQYNTINTGINDLDKRLSIQETNSKIKWGILGTAVMIIGGGLFTAFVKFGGK